VTVARRIAQTTVAVWAVDGVSRPPRLAIRPARKAAWITATTSVRIADAVA
jgi:hypothetical protein